MVTRDRVMMGPQWQVLPAKIKILLTLAHHAEPRTARMGAGLGKIRALFFEFPSTLGEAESVKLCCCIYHCASSQFCVRSKVCIELSSYCINCLDVSEVELQPLARHYLDPSTGHYNYLRFHPNIKTLEREEEGS